MSKKHQLLNKVLKTYSNKISKEVEEQEELIQLWKHPELEGYQGLLAFHSLIYEEYKFLKDSVVKKNTPANAGVCFNTLVQEVLETYPNDKGTISFLIHGVLKELYYGENLSSLDKRSKYLKISKSDLSRSINNIRKNLKL